MQMQINGPKSPGQSTLTPEHRTALSQAASMISAGQTTDAAVEHLIGSGMPRLVAKVLVKQYDKRPVG